LEEINKRLVMQERGKRLIRELKTHILEVMGQIKECQPEAEGVSYRVIEERGGLWLQGFSSESRWLIRSLLSSLLWDIQVDVVRKGRRVRWRLMGDKGWPVD
jgi:hypothetical protein